MHHAKLVSVHSPFAPLMVREDRVKSLNDTQGGVWVQRDRQIGLIQGACMYVWTTSEPQQRLVIASSSEAYYPPSMVYKVSGDYPTEHPGLVVRENYRSLVRLTQLPMALLRDFYQVGNSPGDVEF